MKLPLVRFCHSSLVCFSLILVLSLATSLLSNVTAQTACTFTIEMFDEGGDGWKDSRITVISNGITSTHSLPNGFKGTSTFQATNGKAVILNFTQGAFATEVAFNLLSPDGLVLYSSGPVGAPAPASGEHYFRPAYCPNCPAPKVDSVKVNQITDTTAVVTWKAVSGGKRYTLRYGPKGFPLDKGLNIDSVSTNAKLSGLNPDVEYEVYLLAKCGADSSSIFTGPIIFKTTYNPKKAGSTCIYTLELFDSGNNGWNGAFLRATLNGVNTDFTMAIGASVIHQYSVTGNYPIVFSYNAGLAESEISYRIKDPSGKVIFSDGPFPTRGEVFRTIACPSCPGPMKISNVDINADNAIIAWDTFPGATGNYILEYGPIGFTLGKGKTATFAGKTASGTLSGLKENTWYDVYVKLNCGAESSKITGPLTFKTRWMNDIGVAGLFAPDFVNGCNFKSDQKLTISIKNYGQSPQTLFKFLFAVNGTPANITIPQDGLYTGVVGNDSTYTIEFETPWNFSVPGLYAIEAWTVLKNDSAAVNDTFRMTVVTAHPKPLKEDFEDELIPETWSYNGLIYKQSSHNNTTKVLAKNLSKSDDKFMVTTQRIGPLALKDSFLFDYRLVSFPDGKTAFIPGSKDKLEVQVSTDCGVNFTTVFTIDSASHKPTLDMTRKVIQLSQFAGKAITIRFLATWGKGDYWLDIDNINIPGCPSSLYLNADVINSYLGNATGLIELKPFFGDNPFQYKWSNGDTSRVIFNLRPGIYRVTVTDANGCSDTRSFNISLLVNDQEQPESPDIKLFPNPASHMATLRIKLSFPTDFEIKIINSRGQVLYQAKRTNQEDFETEIDLSDYPPGLFFLRVFGQNLQHVAKLVIAR
jgi:hypothetical protein